MQGLSILKKLKDASSLEDLATILGYSGARSLTSSTGYRREQIDEIHHPEERGRAREICAPIEPLKTLQRRLANVLYACREEI